jgi:hypothetical protein
VDLEFLQPLLVLFVSVAAVPESAFSCFPSRWSATHHHGNLATSKEVHSVPHVSPGRAQPAPYAARRN